MTLIAHQPQGLYVTFSSRHLSWSKRLKLKPCLTKHHMIGRTDWRYLLKQNICLSVGPPCIFRSKLKPLRITGFKGNIRNDDSVIRANGLKVPKTSIGLEESGEAKSESPKAQDVPISYSLEANHTTSPAIHKLFRKWLSMLRTQSSSQEVEEIFGDPPPGVLSETRQGTQTNKSVEVLKVAWYHFLALDATMKIPLLIFVPFYLAVNVLYGAEVSKELTPLWVLGPVIVALYIIIVRWLCALYILSFKLTFKVLKNSPSYCFVAYSYVFRGKFKEDVKALVMQPIVSITNTDYKQLTRKKLKEVGEMIAEKYLDFVESIWPYYCRTIRFLKRANLI